MEYTYAMLPDRVKAPVVDSVILIAGMYATSEVLALFDEVPNGVRVIAFVLLFVVYDPLFTSAFGATIGHSFSNIMVRKESNPHQNINFFSALLRFILKLLLGWLSLLTVTSHTKKRALHDFVGGSIVLKQAKP